MSSTPALVLFGTGLFAHHAMHALHGLEFGNYYLNVLGVEGVEEDVAHKNAIVAIEVDGAHLEVELS